MPIVARLSASSADVVGTIRATLADNQTLRAAPVAADRYKTTTRSSTHRLHLALASNHPRRRGQ